MPRLFLPALLVAVALLASCSSEPTSPSGAASARAARTATQSPPAPSDSAPRPPGATYIDPHT